MSSRDSITPNSSSNLLHQFLVTDSIPTSNQFHSHFLNACHNEDHQPFGQVPTIQSLGERMSRSLDLIHPSDLLEASNTDQHPRRVGPYSSEMLSLTLSSEILFRPIQLRQRPFSHTYLSSSIDNEEAKEVEYYSFPPPPSTNFLNQTSSSSSSSSDNNNNNSNYGVKSFAVDMISNSRYLKPTQSLLHEVVCVGGENVQSSNDRYFNRMSSNSKRGSLSFCSELKSDTLEKAVLSFEMVAGIGAGKSYTALALQAMSRHFCSLRDAITSQIMETRRKIIMSEVLRFQEKENRTCLQQIGMVQSPRQAWRPIRGLPEVSVSILRCWLFEHFLHPSVSNWFINARVRLWKPMIEEMYREEFDGDAYDSSSDPLTTNTQGINEHEEE